jgi:serine/threonine-protein kinase
MYPTVVPEASDADDASGPRLRLAASEPFAPRHGAALAFGGRLPMTIGPGSLVNGKYRLGRLLGEGGMGSIFEARHEFLGTEVALKFLHPALSSRPNIVARFVQEARVSANLKSPHVVSVVDVDQSPEGLAFLVMELLHGEPLSQRLAREPVLPVPLSLTIAVQILLALETAHGLGVVHRDMKPENVFLTDSPGAAGATSDGLLVKILDFGIAKLRSLGEVRAQLTRPGALMGTPEYMAPEQVFAAEAVDARADLYALGAMLFEMLAGRRPVQGDDPRIIATAVMSGQTPRLDAIARRVPPPIADVVAIALAPKPNDRFSSAVAMRQAIVNAAQEASIAIEAPPLPRGGSRIGLAVPGVLGGVGLGVAPPVMFGPGDPSAMVAFDRGHLSPGPAPRTERAPEPPAPMAAPPPVDPHVPLEAGPGETIAAVPTPYAPPVADVPPIPTQPPPPRNGEFGRTVAFQPQGPLPGYETSSGGTDAGFRPPFGFDTPGSAAALPPDEAYYGQDSQGATSRASRRFAWLPYVAMGAVVVAVGAVILYATSSGSSAPAAPAPSATASEPEKPKKKHPKPEDDTEVAPPSESTSAKPPTTSTTTTAPRPPVTASTAPKPLPSISALPIPSTTVKPLPSTSTTRPPDIIDIPLPFPIPTPN